MNWTVITLCYVAVQIKQNTRALVASSRQGLLDADLGLLSDFLQYSIDPILISDEDELSPDDERRFIWIVIKAIRIREFAWHQYRSGGLDEESWQSYMAPVPGLFSSERARKLLELYTGSPEFLEVLHEHIHSSGK